MKLGLALILMVGVGFGLGLCWQKLFVENDEFTISDVQIRTLDGEDARFLTRKRIQQRSGLSLDQTIFAIDVEELEVSLQALPEIKSVSISRRLPGILRVEIEERQPVAWLVCRSLGIVEHDRAEGLLVDEDGIPFKCDSEELWLATKKLPAVMVHRASEGEIVEGEAIEHKGLKAALDLVKLTNRKLEGRDLPAWVVVKDEIILEMKTLDGLLTTLSYYDQERQIENLTKALKHARAQQKTLATANLIPRRNIPVHYR